MKKKKMVRKKIIDSRIQTLIQNGFIKKHRTMFVIIGEKAKEQVVLLHHILSKCSVDTKPSAILWCTKKDTGLNGNHWKKRIKSIKNKVKTGKLDINHDDPLELFVVSNNIRYCYYNESHKVLGNTYKMCILEDFQALTPNLLARTIETVEGGGLIVILLQSLSSLKQLYTMDMDVHQRLRTETHQHVVGRFNKRFLLSLASCQQCLVVDDKLRALPITSKNLEINPPLPSSKEKTKLEIFKETLESSHDFVSVLINSCLTIDQAKVLHKLIEIITMKKFDSTVSLTAARGRGKSATLGLAIAGAVAFGYSNIYISSPTPDNLKTLFQFIVKGLDALGYRENDDYSLVQSANPEYYKAVVRINIFRDNRQTVQYIHPNVDTLNHAELLVIDEAAAIPLPYVKSMLGPYLVFLSSTINGYEGTGRSLSLKLIQELRMQTTTNVNKILGNMTVNKFESQVRKLCELTLDESIRYKPGDKIEQWLTNILCLDTVTMHLSNGLSCYPSPDTCQLYYINRDTLFSYDKASEIFLQRLVSLYVASHYKNSPNDLQMMSDAPAHHLFCLLGPNSNDKLLPDILVVIQVCLEGEIKNETIVNGLGRNRRAAGDLIPWTVVQQYQDNDFAQLSGARIVRIATHPNYHGMGYGTRALKLLKQYYEMKISYTADDNIEMLDNEVIKPPPEILPPLLSKLTERRPERLDYLGVSFGLTESLLKFWKRSNFVLVYLRQTTNDITGEHSCIMLSILNASKNIENVKRLETYWKDFRRRFIMLLSYDFSKYSSAFAISILMNKTYRIFSVPINKEILRIYFTLSDLKRLEMYSNNMTDYHLIMDLFPSLAKLYFFNFINDIHFSPVQEVILLGIGLQHKPVDKMSEELNSPTTQLLGLFNQIVRKSIKYFKNIADDFS